MVGGKKIKVGNRRRNDVMNLAFILVALLLLNYISSFVFHRFDLTAEKRYSLTEPTKNLIKELDDVVFFKVYLEGEFPSGFKRLRSETIEMLNEFRAYNPDGNIQYEFVNPSESADEQVRNDVYRQLYKQGLRPTDLEIKDDDGISQKIIWPGAIATFKGREVPIDLLQSRLGAGPEEMLNSSIENLEYALSNAIEKLTNPNKPKVAFLEGHGELDEFQTADIFKTLSEFYAVERIALDENINSLTSRQAIDKDSTEYVVLNNYAVLVIAKPEIRFTEKDKYLIDQFIMYGGKVLWLIDPLQANMDSLTTSDVTMGIERDLNLSDQLFTYGVRLNNDLILDIQSAMIPLPVGMVGDQPRYELFPWFYFPLLTPATGHPIVNNLNVIKGEFTSSIDLVGDDSIRKDVLLTSSPYTKLAYTPVRISLGITRFEPQREQFNKANVPVAVLLEGKFRSVFKDRLADRFIREASVQFRESGQKTRMIVVSDGDIIKNHVSNNRKKILPLGTDRYTQQEYGNKDFIINAVNYLCDEKELMLVRSRSLKIRLLDKTRINENKLEYQVVNMIGPVFLVLIFGFIFNWRRRKKYSNQ